MLRKFSNVQIVINSLHMKVNKGEVLFQCSGCHKAFSREVSLQRHRKVYVGEKPFQCPECYREFCWKCDLINHWKILQERTQLNAQNFVKNINTSVMWLHIFKGNMLKRRPMYQRCKMNTFLVLFGVMHEKGHQILTIVLRDSPTTVVRHITHPVTVKSSLTNLGWVYHASTESVILKWLNIQDYRLLWEGNEKVNCWLCRFHHL